MYDGSRYILYALLAVPALIVGFYAVVFVLALGPTGLFVVVFLGIAAMATHGWLSGDDEKPRSARRTNCPDCGAPNPIDAGTCGYCEASLEAE